MCNTLDVPWFSPGSLLCLARLIKALEAEDFNPLQRKLPLQEHHLQRIADRTDKMSDKNRLVKVW